MRGQQSREAESPGFDDASWLLIAICGAFLVGFQLTEPFAFSADGAVKSGAMIGLLWVGSRFYTRLRPRPALAAILRGMTQIILFSIGGAILSYMVAAQGGALWDARLQGWDRALGLDWLSYVRWINDHPAIAQLYRWAYVSVIPQLLILVMALAIAGRPRTMRVIICASILSGIVAVLTSGLTPAVSNFVYLGLTPADLPGLDPAAAYVHHDHFVGLRDGSLRLIDIANLEGIITFPSYHAALGAIFVWGFLRLGPIGWPGAIWAGLMLLATPVDGAHYFVDVFAGIALAVVALALSPALVERRWFEPVGRLIGRREAVPPPPAALPA